MASTAISETPDGRESVTALQGAAQSLLLPLSSRALETARERPILRDPLAVRLLARLEFDAAALTRNRLYHTIICLRTRRFDAVVEEFLCANPDGTVVNLGCGLDTRFERVDNGRASWFEIDFPEVVALRRRLIDEGSRRHFIAGSITDRAWMDVLEPVRDRPILFLAEGVLMFLDGAQVQELVCELGRRFAKATLLFDAVKPIEVHLARYHPTLRRTQAQLRWGLSSGRVLEAWHPTLELRSEWFYCEEAEPRLGWYRLLRFLPWLGRTSWILCFRVGSA